MDKRLLAEIASVLGRRKKILKMSADAKRKAEQKRKRKRIISNKSRKINQAKGRLNKFQR